MHPFLRPVLHHPRFPAPATIQALSALRRRVGGELLERERAALADIATRWRRDRARARPEIEALADRLLVELRAQVDDRAARGSAAERLAGRADRHLRRDGVEHIDDPAVDPRVRTRIISDLDRVNAWIGAYRQVLEVAAAHFVPAGRTEILDLASGHGGLPLWVLAHAASQGLALDVTASDLHDDYLALARASAQRRGLPLRTRVLDALAMDLDPGSVDVVLCTLALHHFSPGRIAVLLAESRRVARRGVVFMDGLRAPQQLLGAVGLFVAAGAHVPSVHDCAVSVRRMFVPEELALVAACAPGGEQVRARYHAPAWVALTAPPWPG